MDNRFANIALAAFDALDWIIGTMTGGIEAPRILDSIEVNEITDDHAIIKVSYTHPATCGLSDCRYHDSRAGKYFEHCYVIKDNTITLNGDEDIFSIKGWEKDQDIMGMVHCFYDKFGLKYPEKLAA